jgi:hypothetical protein
MFDYVAHGFLDATCDVLTPLEIDHLVFGARLITYEQVIRFLGDYLNGDTYYKTHRPGHNLDRTRTQIKLLAEIDFILARAADARVVVDLLAEGRIPERVTHNDTKLNNVMIDERTGEGICVIDLDTVMPGSALYDFGDLVRTGAVTGAEDEPDLSRVRLDLGLFEYVAHGFLDATCDVLTPLEIDHLVFGARLITYEQAIRFLGDYLNGDTYYKTHRPGHNLDRTRTQIKLLAEIEQHAETLDAIVARYR